jgi:hypothetical protein
MDDNRNRLQNEAYPDSCPGEVTRREFLRGCGNKQLFEAEL